MASEKFRNFEAEVRKKRRAMEEYADSDWGWYAVGTSLVIYILLVITNCVVALVPGLNGGGQACKGDAPFMWWCACLSAPILFGTWLFFWRLVESCDGAQASSSDDDDDY